MPERQEQVVLVDPQDNPVGTMEKIEAHRRGLLHRAFCIFLVDGEGRLLLQRRALAKYHSGGLWTNTCCSHPRPGEAVPAAARRRLQEEMGITCPLEACFSFLYRAEFPNGLIEHELAQVFMGRFDGKPVPDPDEADDWVYMSLPMIKRGIEERPADYTAWFKIALPQVEQAGAPWLIPPR